MLRGVRGATTAQENSREAVLAATRELLKQMAQLNQWEVDDIGAIIFSSSPDLDAAFPAAAARSLGWAEVPVFGTQEIDCPSGLPLCIRVLVLWNTELSPKEIKHLYQYGAKVLRPDLSDDVNP